MFTDVLRSLRKKNGDTQESLAAKLNVPVRTYASWERCERIMPNDVLVSIADLYGVTVDYLLGREDPKEDPVSVQAVVDVSGSMGMGKSSMINDIMKIVSQLDPKQLSKAKHNAELLLLEQQIKDYFPKPEKK